MSTPARSPSNAGALVGRSLKPEQYRERIAEIVGAFGEFLPAFRVVADKLREGARDVAFPESEIVRLV